MFVTLKRALDVSSDDCSVSEPGGINWAGKEEVVLGLSLSGSVSRHDLPDALRSGTLDTQAPSCDVSSA